jgi:hypothetical protein
MRPSQTRPRALILAALSAALVVVLSQGTAWAQGSAPSAFRSMDVTLLDTPDIQQPLLLISGELPASTQLPAEVVIPIPTKSRIQWAGEILGGPTNQDPQAQPRVESKAGYDLAIFTLTKARTGQVEVPVPDVAKVAGGTRDLSLSWISAAAVPDVKVAVRIAQTSKVTKPPAGATRTAGADGTVQYARTFSSVKPGQKLSMQLAYTPGAAPPSGATPQQTPQTPGVLTGSAPRSAAPQAWMLYAIATVVVAGVYFFLSKRAARAAEPEPEPAPVKRPTARRTAATQRSAMSTGKGKSQGGGKPKGNGQSGGKPKARKAPATPRAKAPAQPPDPEPEADLLGDIFDD